MRQFIDIVTKSVLTEATDYKLMANPILKLVREQIPADRLENEEDAMNLIAKAWADHVKYVKASFKREDRIVWWLKRVQQEVITNFNKVIDDILDDPVILANYDFDLHDEIKHYLNIPSEEIQQFRFPTGMPYGELLAELQRMESRWLETLDDDTRLIPVQPNEETHLITFPDGMVWVMLDKGGCSLEAKAMGHCGNGSGQAGQNLISLRKLHPSGKYWIPHLTFIREKNGYLGEMKGRANQKPIDKYHPYIVELLKSDHIHGIDGGGYAPEKNFDLVDLPEHQARELAKLNPELRTTKYLLTYDNLSNVNVQGIAASDLQHIRIETPFGRVVLASNMSDTRALNDENEVVVNVDLSTLLADAERSGTGGNKKDFYTFQLAQVALIDDKSYFGAPKTIRKQIPYSILDNISEDNYQSLAAFLGDEELERYSTGNPSSDSAEDTYVDTYNFIMKKFKNDLATWMSKNIPTLEAGISFYVTHDTVAYPKRVEYIESDGVVALVLDLADAISAHLNTSGIEFEYSNDIQNAIADVPFPFDELEGNDPELSVFVNGVIEKLIA